MNEFERKFLTNRDHTGRFIVTSLRTGKKYFVEPIGNPKTGWGDVSSYGRGGVVTGSYGDKYRGSIDKDESLITTENGFDEDKIHTLDIGQSPMAYIDMLDARYETV